MSDSDGPGTVTSSESCTDRKLRGKGLQHEVARNSYQEASGCYRRGTTSTTRASSSVVIA
eukprot:2660605-Rhodomonas_salina.1